MNWYGFIIACGIICCVVAAYFIAKHRGIEGDTVLDILLYGLPCAIVFARIYYVVFDLIDPNGQDWTFTKFIGLDDGGLSGLAIYGADIGIVIGMFLLSLWKNRKKLPKNKRISFLQLLDLTFTFVVLGQAIGRWGNYANEEAHGYAITDPSLMWFPMGVEVNGTWYYATFFYESMWDFACFAILLFLYIGKHKSFDGFTFSCYCIWYGIGRAWIEGMRSDSLWLVPPDDPATGAGGIRVSQLLSILLIVFGVVFIVVHIIRAKKANKKPFVFVRQDKLSLDYFGYEKTKLYLPMPDIKFWKDRHKNKEEEDKDDGILVDDNGVAIRGAPRFDKSDEDGHDDENAPDVEVRDDVDGNVGSKPSDDEETEPEEIYEDRWDD